jgi:aspartyl-tRNA(Asn)/glutamyl-tRNA(Gln) amidotransferase subunit B
LGEVRSRVVELPLARKQRFMRDYQLPAPDAETFKNDVPLGDYFERIAGGSNNPKALANWVINNLRAKLAETNANAVVEQAAMGLESAEVERSGLANLKFKPEALLELVTLTDSGRISSRIAQEVFAEMFETGESPAVIVEKTGLTQVSDTGTIEKFCDEVIATHPGPANDFRAGKVAALNFLKGQVMKVSKGKANPALVGRF